MCTCAHGLCLCCLCCASATVQLQDRFRSEAFKEGLIKHISRELKTVLSAKVSDGKFAARSCFKVYVYGVPEEGERGASGYCKVTRFEVSRERGGSRTVHVTEHREHPTRWHGEADLLLTIPVQDLPFRSFGVLSPDTDVTLIMLAAVSQGDLSKDVHILYRMQPELNTKLAEVCNVRELSAFILQHLRPAGCPGNSEKLAVGCFLSLCVMAGCDFTSGIPKISHKTVLKLAPEILQYLTKKRGSKSPCSLLSLRCRALCSFSFFKFVVLQLAGQGGAQRAPYPGHGRGSRLFHGASRGSQAQLP